MFVENNQIKYEEANKIKKTFNDIDNNKKDHKYNWNLDKDNNDLINFNNTNDSNRINNNNHEKKNFNNYTNNIICLYDFLNVNLKSKNKKKSRGNIFNKKYSKTSKTNLIIEDNKIPNGDHNHEQSNESKNNELKVINNKKINKKNTFRLNQRSGETFPKDLSNNNKKNKNKKINFLFPLSLSLTNSTKMMTFKEKENNINNLKLVSVKEISKNNSKKDLRNGHKFTYLLDKLEKNRNIYNNSLINNGNFKNNNKILTRNSQSFIINKKPLINSPLFKQKSYIAMNDKNLLINGIYYSFRSKRSKSTSNFLRADNKNTHQHPKTTKANQKLFNLDLLDGKNSLKFIYSNGFERIKLNQTTMIKFSPSIKHNSQKIKIKKLGLKKDI
jgi:hypothetical protein